MSEQRQYHWICYGIACPDSNAIKYVRAGRCEEGGGMSWDEPLPTNCEEDGKGGCKKHPPTIRLTQFQWWLIDEHCPGQRVLWPAVQYQPNAGALTQPVAEAYYYLIDPKYPPSFKNSILRRVQKAEKLRLKEMKKGGGA